ncbi:MAG TPA: hypothetical protein VND89_01605 [Acidimicrobiales bacterium]|nr:hypothetical protein [Acidimicrobiales bacterium]
MTNTLSPRSLRGDEGMTLVELLVTMLVLPLIIGGLAFGLIAVFSLQSSVSGRVTDSGNAQTLSATYMKDVQSAQAITTSATPICGTGTQLFAVAWGATASGFVNYVSYDTMQNGAAANYSLTRTQCADVPSSVPTSSQLVATDLSATSASAPPILTCSPSLSACSSQARTAWVTASGVSQVALTITETQSQITNSLAAFAFDLSATPRGFTEATNATQLPTFAPFSLLSPSSCSALSLGNNSVLSINVGTGTDNGALEVASPCPGAVAIAANAQLLATSINTSDTALNSVSAGSGAVYPSNEYYTSQVGDPFASLTPPADPPSGGSVVSCTNVGSVYTCPPGYYTTDPGASWVNGATVRFTPGGTFWFEQGLTVSNNANVTFATGTYIFDGTSTALSTAPNTTIDATSGVLFYVHSGAVTFGNNATINVKGLAQYNYVALWDAGASGTTNPITLGNNGSAGYGYGGIYVPNGEAILNNNGTVTAAFLVANTAVISNNVSLNITSP